MFVLLSFFFLYNELMQIYEAWETDKIISVELWRNLSLCLIAVAIISLALLGDFRYVDDTALSQSLWPNFGITLPSCFRLTVMVVTCILATLVDLVSFQALSPFIPLIFFLNCLVALFVSFHFHCILATLVDLVSFLLILLSSFLSCPVALFVSFHSILFLYFHFAFFCSSSGFPPYQLEWVFFLKISYMLTL